MRTRVTTGRTTLMRNTWFETTSSQVRLTRIGSRTALLPRDLQVKPPAARDLVYLAPSPDFCHLDPDNGIPGTAGRRCNGKITEDHLIEIIGIIQFT